GKEVWEGDFEEEVARQSELTLPDVGTITQEEKTRRLEEEPGPAEILANIKAAKRSRTQLRPKKNIEIQKQIKAILAPAVETNKNIPLPEEKKADEVHMTLPSKQKTKRQSRKKTRENQEKMLKERSGEMAASRSRSRRAKSTVLKLPKKNDKSENSVRKSIQKTIGDLPPSQEKKIPMSYVGEDYFSSEAESDDEKPYMMTIRKSSKRRIKKGKKFFGKAIKVGGELSRESSKLIRLPKKL
ncbi:hypothetical protein RFI_39150, partial [Reticulomyxa filosa]